MTSAIKPTSITFKKTEAEWYNYHNTLKEIARLREEIMNPFEEEPNDPTIVAGKVSARKLSDPTANVSSRLLLSKQLSYLSEVVEAIEKVYNVLPDNFKELVRVKYWNKSKELNWDGVSAELHISRPTAIRWRNDIIYATIEVLGWR